MRWVRKRSAAVLLLVLVAGLAALPSVAAAEEPTAVDPPSAQAPEVDVEVAEPGPTVAEQEGAAVAPAAGEVTGQACAANTSRVVSGSVRGSNGRRVNALVGLVLIDAFGRGLDRFGCPAGGYAYTASVNGSVGPEGEPADSATAFSFTNIPANAVTFSAR